MSEAPAIETVVDSYLAALATADPDDRAALVSRAWADDGQFVDPLLDAQGHEAIADLADVVMDQFPGHTFRRTTGIDAHHGLIRFGWELAADDGTAAAGGIDVGIVNPDGRLARIAGFFGDPPALESSVPEASAANAGVTA